jgi:hypothetical protein
MIPNSNLLLVAINKLNEVASNNENTIIMTTEAKKINVQERYNASHPCHKLYLNGLYIRRLTECYVS